MLISWVSLAMRCLLMQKRKGKEKIPQGFISSFTSAQLKVLDDIQNWRDGKAKPSVAILKAMRQGEYGEPFRFTAKLADAIDSNSLEDFNNEIYKCLEKQLPFPEYLQTIRLVDEAIMAYGKTEVKAGLIGEVRSHVVAQTIIEARELLKGKKPLAPRQVCLLYLYSIALFDAQPILGECVFTQLFATGEPTLVRGFLTLIKEGIKKRKHKITELAHEMFPKMDDSEAYKKMWSCFKTGTRLMLNIKEMANAYFNIVFSSNEPCNEERRIIFSKVWGFVVMSAAIMDVAKEKWGIDFVALARECNYNGLIKNARKIAAKIPVENDT